MLGSVHYYIQEEIYSRRSCRVQSKPGTGRNALLIQLLSRDNIMVHITPWSLQVQQHLQLLSQVQMGPHLSLLPHNLLLFQESH